MAIGDGELPPSDPEQERMLIGFLLIQAKKEGHAHIDQLIELKFKPEFFFENCNKRVYEAMVAMHAESQDFSGHNVLSKLRDMNRISELPPGYVEELINYPVHLSEEAFAFAHESIASKWKARQLIDAARRAMVQAYNHVDPKQVIRSLCDTAESLEGQDMSSQLQSLFPIMKERIKYLTETQGNGPTIVGIPSGIGNLDTMIGGFHPGEVTVVAARPGQGKTALAVSIGVNIAKEGGKGVAFFSLEMPKQQISDRILSCISNVEMSKMRNLSLSPRDWQLAIGSMAGAPGLKNIWIDDGAVQTPSTVRAKLNMFRRQLKSADASLSLVIVDYIQLMGADKAMENRQNEVATISKMMKRIAKEFEVPVILLSQLNRQVEGRPDKRPLLSDLRESGAIEQDADLVIMLYRDEYYTPNSRDKGTAELIIAKHRNGETGMARSRFDGKIMKFDNLTEEQSYQYSMH